MCRRNPARQQLRQQQKQDLARTVRVRRLAHVTGKGLSVRESIPKHLALTRLPVNRNKEIPEHTMKKMRQWWERFCVQPGQEEEPKKGKKTKKVKDSKKEDHEGSKAKEKAEKMIKEKKDKEKKEKGKASKKDKTSKTEDPPKRSRGDEQEPAAVEVPVKEKKKKVDEKSKEEEAKTKKGQGEGR